MTKPRLLFISNLFPDRAEPYRGLDNATLLGHLRGRFDIRAISPRPTLGFHRERHPRECDRGFEPLYLPARYVPKFGSRFNHRLMAWGLREPLRELRSRWPFEVVLSSWIFPDSCAVALLARDFPLVSIAQGSDVHQYLNDPARRAAIIAGMRRASAIVTRSAALARLLEAAGVPGEKLHPVYNGIDFGLFRPVSREEALAARGELGLPPGPPVILFVGNFLPIKGFLRLIRAHAALEEAHLVLVGGGPLEKEARALAATLGSSGRITFAGRRSAGEVARFMQAADVLALPSRNEGVPNVILEAFACGLPVVASRVGGIPEVLDQPFLGELVPAEEVSSLSEALRRAVAAAPDRERIRQHALRFSWEAAADAYTALLDRARRP